MASACIKVNKRDAQDAKNALIKAGLLDPDRDPMHDGDSVLFPVQDGADATLKKIMRCPFNTIDGACPASQKKRRGNLADLLARELPGELAQCVPRAFNIIGTIAILDIDDQLAPFKEAIARAIREIHPHLTSVFSKQSERAGDFRTSRLDLLWGSDDPVTRHVESGCRFLVDVREAFFDPRLVHEHARAIESIRAACDGTGTSNVADLFCGVGPFIVPLAKDPRISAWAVDLNPRAIELLGENIKENHIDVTRVHSHLMDARTFLERFDLDGGACPREFDAIILNLPRSAHEYLGACKPRTKVGTTLFWYTIAREFFEGKEAPGDDPAAIQERLRGLSVHGDANPVSEACVKGLGAVKALGFSIARITRVKPFSPYRYTYCFELVA
ncbi:MAG: methyltransferase [Candidatus Lokiarchaeota archaeon]|nr:methyltransferase [Candidatus Lokiarchaeota archaeon]